MTWPDSLPFSFTGTIKADGKTPLVRSALDELKNLLQLVDFIVVVVFSGTEGMSGEIEGEGGRPLGLFTHEFLNLFHIKASTTLELQDQRRSR